MFQLPQRQKITAILEVIIIMIIWKLLIGTQGKKEMRKAYVGTFVSRILIVYLTKKKTILFTFRIKCNYKFKYKYIFYQMSIFL